ncbi:hypothetical protein LWC08_05295 [Desulfobaculum bizertense]|uniref:hypothetical protein n=1 Tax=Desulfobaculum bizertense TaxID=376490 RepID=UPI001F17969F|nr:hypothetical protein [Desulfobaculum bizertense]UIJ38991.1 hypothetical protein LWC08_05295 [Desulfobaculum bizertense]
MSNAKNWSMDCYRINERAWSLVLARLQQLKENGHSMAALGRLLKVNRATIKQWMDYGQGGDRISFRNMIHYLDKLQIPLAEVFSVDLEELPEKMAAQLDANEKNIASTLKATADVLGKKIDTIARQAFGDELDSVKVHAMLTGECKMHVGEFINICKAIGVEPSQVIERALELTKEEKEDIAKKSDS